MKKILIGTMILCILHSILLVNQSLGINVILFTIPLLIFLITMMREKSIIKNKKGLLFMIPIVLLSATYFIYDNTFKYLNMVAIPILYLLMYIFTIKPMKTFEDTIVELLNLLIKPLNSVGIFTREGVKIIFNNKQTSTTKKILQKNNLRIIKSLLIVLPIVVIVLMLLSSADSIFGDLFKKIFILELNWENIDEIFIRIIVFIFLFFAIGSTTYFVTEKYIKEKRIKGPRKEHGSLTINMLLISLDVIYVIFDIIQINSLMLHRVATGFNYAEYARSGFFQLMIISCMNISIILFSKKCKEERKTKIMSIIMVLLTLIIIFSSYYRMSLYEAAYGYTILRLGVYVILITEAILLLPTICYIINKKIQIVNYYMAITITIYSVINCFSVDRIISENNIHRYEKTGKIDIEYLENANYDNLNQLRYLYQQVMKDQKIALQEKEELRSYIETMDRKNKTNILEWNISKNKSKK